MDELLAEVPPQLHARFREVVALTDAFCAAHLDDEYRDICRQLAVEVCQEGSPVTRGKAAGWAAGVVAAVGFVNFLGDPSQPHSMTTEEMARHIGVSPATLHSKSKAIRDELDIIRMGPRYCTRGMIAGNPLVWLVEVRGVIVDLRQAPRDVQEAAYRAGLIPYVPDDRGEGE